MPRTRLTDEEQKRKSLERYHKWVQSHPERAREVSRNYRQRHPEKRKETTKKYREEHRDEILEKNRQYKDENREKVRAYGRLYYEMNKEKYQQWQDDHPEYGRRQCQKRRRMIHQLPYTLTPIQREQKKAGGCMFCGTREKLEVAHDIPVSRGGGMTDDNTICLCQRCNRKMGTKTLAEVLGLS